MRFSGVLGFISDLLPFLQSAEKIFGAGKGSDKRKYVEGRLRTLTKAAEQRLGVLDELDPAVKANRGALIDLAVDEAILHGDLPGTEDQRLKAGLALGFVTDQTVIDAYGKLQKGDRLSSYEDKAWQTYKTLLPPLPVPREVPLLLPLTLRPKPAVSKKGAKK